MYQYIKQMNEELKHKFYISTDKSKLDIQMIHDFLRTSYWAENIPLASVEKSISNSLSFGLYENNQQVCFISQNKVLWI
jgi:hypothetical protein